jgi:hypothetical protein
MVIELGGLEEAPQFLERIVNVADTAVIGVDLGEVLQVLVPLFHQGEQRSVRGEHLLILGRRQLVFGVGVVGARKHGSSVLPAKLLKSDAPPPRAVLIAPLLVLVGVVVEPPKRSS